MACGSRFAACDYARASLQKVVAVICSVHGWQSTTREALNILTILLERRLLQIARAVNAISSHRSSVSSLNSPNLSDLQFAFNKCGVTIVELSEYAAFCSSSPVVYPGEQFAFPLETVTNLQFDSLRQELGFVTTNSNLSDPDLALFQQAFPHFEPYFPSISSIPGWKSFLPSYVHKEDDVTPCSSSSNRTDLKPKLLSPFQHEDDNACEQQGDGLQAASSSFEQSDADALDKIGAELDADQSARFGEMINATFRSARKRHKHHHRCSHLHALKSPRIQRDRVRELPKLKLRLAAASSGLSFETHDSVDHECSTKLEACEASSSSALGVGVEVKIESEPPTVMQDLANGHTPRSDQGSRTLQDDDDVIEFETLEDSCQSLLASSSAFSVPLSSLEASQGDEVKLDRSANTSNDSRVWRSSFQAKPAVSASRVPNHGTKKRRKQDANRLETKSKAIGISTPQTQTLWNNNSAFSTAWIAAPGFPRLISGANAGRNGEEATGIDVDQDYSLILCPHCSTPDDGSPMVCCDGCNSCFHFACTGLLSMPTDAEQWFCVSCSEKTALRFAK